MLKNVINNYAHFCSINIIIIILITGYKYMYFQSSLKGKDYSFNKKLGKSKKKTIINFHDVVFA